MARRISVAVLVVGLAGTLGLVNRAMAAPAIANAPSPSLTPGVAAALIDSEAELPELQEFMQSGPNDVRDIAIDDHGFVVATGAAIIRYQYSGAVPKATAVYTNQHGLPSGNCYLLRHDVNGGIWAHCQGGIGYLAPRADRWQAFTDKNGLARGNATSVALSADGRRVWVSSTGGLSTASVKDRKWQVFPSKNLIDLFVHPTQEVVWCRKLMHSACMCGRHVVTMQFTLKSREWREIPESGKCSHVAPTPICFDVAEDVLWMSSGYAPPLLYDPKKNATRTWTNRPNWERKGGHSDWFGTMVPATNGGAGAWFATNAGLWRFDFKQDRWQGRLRGNKPALGEALVAKSNDGTILYWACEGVVASYDVANDKWTDLWQGNAESARGAPQSLALSPDGTFLWLIGSGGILVGEIATRKAVTLTDADQPGLTAAKFVRFDPAKRLGLIATPQGVVCADFGGNLRYALARPAPPILHRVSSFAFAPDGSEVWCLMKDEQGWNQPAAVLQPGRNRWEVVPAPKTSAQFLSMAFSHDGKTVWLSQTREGDDDSRGIVQRRPGTLEWEKFAPKMPGSFDGVDRLWVTPKDDELWMGTQGDGLLRVKLASNEVALYGEKGYGYVGPAVQQDHELIGNFIYDLTFAKRGNCAVCSTGGGKNAGIALIDVDTGKALNFPTDSEVSKLVASPDNRTVWCVVRNSQLWGFDVQTRFWTHKCSVERGLPLKYFETAETSLDGRFVWLRGGDGVAAYGVHDKSWRSFRNEEWACDADDAPLRITSDGRHVVCGHRRGIALINVDGSGYTVLSLGPGIKECFVSQIVPVPGTADYVCSVSHPNAGGLYYVNVTHRRLRKLKDMGGLTTSVMAVGPDGFLWLSVPGRIFCVNPRTGQERTGLDALQIGAPMTTLLSRDGQGR